MRNITGILVLLTVIGCGKNTSGKHPSSTINPIQDRPLEVTQKEIVNFQRQEQMVSRYDCQGNLTSRKFETINSLSKKITIDYQHRKTAWEYSVYNRRTRSNKKGALTSDGKFVTDYAPTVFNMRVKKGINDVEYAFFRCTRIELDSEGLKKCVGAIELEKEGIVQLDVYYSSETLRGEQIIKPSSESCRSR